MYVVEVGMLAKALAGHDKDKIYLIVEISKDYIYLVDGRTRTLNNPKRKKQKHIQIICEPHCVEKIRDEDVRKMIKQYNQRVKK